MTEQNLEIVFLSITFIAVDVWVKISAYRKIKTHAMVTCLPIYAGFCLLIQLFKNLTAELKTRRIFTKLEYLR